MKEIILSFFAVIGIAFLAVHFFDYLFYRNTKDAMRLIVDLRGKSQEQIMELFEMIASVRSRKSGAATVGELIILTDKRTEYCQKTLYECLQAYGIRGDIYETSDENWKEKMLNCI